MITRIGIKLKIKLKAQADAQASRLFFKKNLKERKKAEEYVKILISVYSA